MCAEGCEGVFLYSLISIREKVFSIKNFSVIEQIELYFYKEK